VAAADEVAKGMSENLLSPFIGIRVKTFSDECKVRSIRTLDIFLTRLAEKTGGKLPPELHRDAAQGGDADAGVHLREDPRESRSPAGLCQKDSLKWRS
jgi:hypothetical protein